MQVVLSMFRSDGDRRSFSLHKETTIVGRKEDCDLRIPLGEISRKHCRITKEDASLKIEDLGSSNGTYRNGERVQAATVVAGDTIQVGSIAFVVQIDGTPADEEMQPVLAQRAESEESGAPAAESDDSDVAPAAVDAEDPAGR
jgi:pSer/pThr/pTyr-binding forkhead associated (FHA) protein